MQRLRLFGYVKANSNYLKNYVRSAEFFFLNVSGCLQQDTFHCAAISLAVRRISLGASRISLAKRIQLRRKAQHHLPRTRQTSLPEGQASLAAKRRTSLLNRFHRNDEHQKPSVG